MLQCGLGSRDVGLCPRCHPGSRGKSRSSFYSSRVSGYGVPASPSLKDPQKHPLAKVMDGHRPRMHWISWPGETGT